MKLAKGPRPWSVRLSTALLLCVALLRLVQRLSAPGDYGFVWQGWAPIGLSDEELGIVGASALFTIACIPPFLLWFLASRIARILIGVMAGLGLLNLPDLLAMWDRVFAIDLIAIAIPTIAFIVLLTPSASRWIATKGRRAADEFA